MTKEYLNTLNKVMTLKNGVLLSDSKYLISGAIGLHLLDKEELEELTKILKYYNEKKNVYKYKTKNNSKEIVIRYHKNNIVKNFTITVNLMN